MKKRKFKLVETYPGSPKLNEIVELSGTNPIYYRSLSVMGKLVSASHVEGNKFWKDITYVIDKEYEVTTYKFNTGEVYARHTNAPGLFFPIGAYSAWPSAVYEDAFTTGSYKKEASIYSIKRLSDGEIFTVGDLLSDDSFTKSARHDLSEGPHDNIITRIAEVKNFMKDTAGYVSVEKGKLMFSASNIYDNLNVLLEDAKKYKGISIKTEDGKTILEKQSCWYVNKYGFINEYVVHSHSHEVKELKFFSTEKLARDYSDKAFPKYVFNTEDGVQVFTKNIVYLVNKTTFEVTSYVVTNVTPHKNFISFSTEELALKYKRKNQILFTTEDGVSIRFGETYITVKKESFAISISNHANSAPSLYLEDGSIGSKYFLFKDVEKARDFAKDKAFFTKRVLSLEDVAKAYVTATRKDKDGKYSDQAMILHNLIKSRL